MYVVSYRVPEKFFVHHGVQTDFSQWLTLNACLLGRDFFSKELVFKSNIISYRSL